MYSFFFCSEFQNNYKILAMSVFIDLLMYSYWYQPKLYARELIIKMDSKS